MKYCKDYMALSLVLIAVAILFSGCTKTLKFNKISNETRLPSLITLHFSLQTQNGEPVPYLKASDFVIKEDGREVSLFESKQTILPRNKQFELVTLLLLDLSGSIIESGSIPSLQEAMKVFIDTVSESQIVSMYAFDGRKQIQQLLPFTTDKNRMIAAVDELKKYKPMDPSTNLNGAVLHGLPIIKKRVIAAKKTGKITSGTMILFTDGTDQAGRIPDNISRATALKSKSSIFTIGLGGEIDKEHLKSIGKSGFEFADDTDDIVEAFASIADKIKRESNKYYAIAYCSPKRAGEHNLEISVRDTKGSLGYQFNATGFAPNCEPTKALKKRVKIEKVDEKNKKVKMKKVGVEPVGSMVKSTQVEKNQTDKSTKQKQRVDDESAELPELLETPEDTASPKSE